METDGKSQYSNRLKRRVYRRNYRPTEARPTLGMSDAARIRFYSEPEPNTGCWLWTGSMHWNGYGCTYSAGRKMTAHRLAYEAFRGPIPDGSAIDHLCRVRCCVNPAHLEAVTQRENLRRGIGLIASNMAKTHCVRGHPLSGENIRLVGTHRHCIECRRMYGRKAYRDRNRIEEVPVGENPVGERHSMPNDPRTA